MVLNAQNSLLDMTMLLNPPAITFFAEVFVSQMPWLMICPSLLELRLSRHLCFSCVSNSGKNVMFITYVCPFLYDPFEASELSEHSLNV